MKDYNILYLPVILLFIGIYGCLILTLGLFIGVKSFDNVVVKSYNYLKDKFYFQILLFLLNVFLWILLWHYYLHNYLYTIINNFKY